MNQTAVKQPKMSLNDYKAAYRATELFMLNMQRENEKMRKIIEYYAKSTWRDLSTFDRGQRAIDYLAGMR